MGSGYRENEVEIEYLELALFITEWKTRSRPIGAKCYSHIPYVQFLSTCRSYTGHGENY